MSGCEDEMTAWFQSQSNLVAADFPIGIGDDMAEICWQGGSVFITCDMLAEGVHFDLQRASLRQVGYKAMAVSLSDCAAMATVPVAAVASIMLPAGWGQEQLKRLYRGIRQAGDRFDCALVGGDLTRGSEGMRLAVNVSMLSRSAGHPAVRRSAAQAGDCICVTGRLGGASQGRHLDFEPRVREALRIAGHVELHSMIDISDGLSTDLNRICGSSGVGAVVEEGAIPISAAAQKGANPLGLALNEGEDFELLFTLSQQNCEQLLARWNEQVSITKIGRITGTKKIQLQRMDGTMSDLRPGGYDHLRR